MPYIFSTSSQIWSQKMYDLCYLINIHTPNLSSSINLIFAKDEFKWQRAKQN